MPTLTVTISDCPTDIFDYCNPDLNGAHEFVYVNATLYTFSIGCVILHFRRRIDGHWELELTDYSLMHTSDPTQHDGATPPADETVEFPSITGAAARIEYS